ncbi:MAG: hypothetical protein N2423_06560 [Novosphingobium sp.]|nr:hypothetical protein [Novosphingobium sp.]
MTDPADLTAWSATLLGLYLLVAGISALRNPASWRVMIEEIAASAALQLLCGLLELLVGVLLWLANPWAPVDPLACILKAAGAVMMIEALMIAGFCDVYIRFWLRMINPAHRGWSLLSMVLGLGLAVPGMLRLT